MLLKLSVIVPLLPGDQAWSELAPDLAHLPKGTEVLFASPRPPAGSEAEAPQLDGGRLRLAWLETPLGRAAQLNRAAARATGDYLWFLHADSRLAPGAVAALEDAVRLSPSALHYFDLRFAKGGPPLMPLNDWGVWLRSHVLRLPFGDQGFCLSRELFGKLGGFAENAPYGEDHLFVWQALRSGIAIRPVGSWLTTSPRKYRDRGWLRTTLRHQVLTYKQAWPELVSLVRARVRT